jgi:LysM repeat protein
MLSARTSPRSSKNSKFEIRNSNFSRRGNIILKGLFILILTGAVFGGGAYFTYILFLKPAEELKAETSLGSPSPPPDATIPEYQRIRELKDSHQWVDARTAYEHFIETYPASTELEAAKDDLGEINVAIYFSGGPSPDKEAYVLKPGDTLAHIERKVKVSGDVIMRSNGITDPRRLRVGDTLYIPHPDFSLVIDRKTRIVTLYDHARFFKQYHPTNWTAPAVKGNPAPIEGRVEDVASFINGVRVAFGSRDYEDSTHRVQISPGGYNLLTDPAEGGDKSGAGIDLSSSDMDELSALLTRGVPVSIR